MKKIGLFLLAFFAGISSLIGQNITTEHTANGKTPVFQTFYVQNPSDNASILQVQVTEGQNALRRLPQITDSAFREPMNLTGNSENVIPIPAQVPPFILTLPNPQLILTGASQFDTPQKTVVAFAEPESTETSPAIPAPTFAAQSESKISIAPLPSPKPQPAAPARPIAAEAVTKTHRLAFPAQTFEKNLIDKLGSRFVPVRNLEASQYVSRFRLPVQDGTDVELVLDSQHNTATITGSSKMVDSCLQIVRLLDTESKDGAVTKFLPVQQSNVLAVQRTADIVNQESQRLAQANPLRQGQRQDQRQEPETPEEITSGSVLGPVQIDIIDGLDTMVIIGTPKDVAAIQNMLKQLETMSLEHEPVIELVPMKHADSLRISRVVQQLYAQVYQARRGTVTMLPLIKPNTILLVGKQESIVAAKELIAKLDTAVNPNANFQIFRLKHAASETLATQITQSFTGRPGYGNGLEAQLSVVSDFRTNSLIVQASPRDLAEIAAMIRQLDTSGSDVTNDMKVFYLKNAMASELATTLQNAFAGRSGGSTGAFGGGTSGTNAQQRGSMITLGKIDADGNLIRSSVLYDVTIVADTRSNTLLVTAPPETMPLIEVIVQQLDQLPSAESKIKVFELVNGDAYALTTMLTNLFAASTTGGGFGGGTTGTSQIATVRPGIEEGESTLVSVRFQTDVRTNSIIACGSEGDMAVVEALLLRLDAENKNNRKVMLLKLVNTPAEQIAPILQTYITNERQIDIQNSTTLLPQSPLEQYHKELNVVAEPISNSLIISTTPRYYNQIKKIVQELDERPLMVAIQVLIAEVQMNSNKDRGIEIGLQDSLLFDRSMASTAQATAGQFLPGFLFGDSRQGLPLGNVNAGTVGTQGISSLGVQRTGSNGIGGFTFSASSESVSVLVRALETQEKIRILSRPQLVTLHNKRAAILVGQDVPFAGDITTTNNQIVSSTEWKSVGTILDVTPRIMPDGMVAMAVYVERSSVGSTNGGLQQPTVNNTNAQTTINAMDGQTVVFAGLITEQKEMVNRSVPGLNKIPVIKHLFEYDSQVCQRSELLIVMTPTIIRNREDMELLKQQETARMHWCINDVVKLTGNSNMRLRSDEWLPSEIEYRSAVPMILNENQLPPENKIPIPVLAPMIE